MNSNINYVIYAMFVPVENIVAVAGKVFSVAILLVMALVVSDVLVVVIFSVEVVIWTVGIKTGSVFADGSVVVLVADVAFILAFLERVAGVFLVIIDALGVVVLVILPGFMDK